MAIGIPSYGARILYAAERPYSMMRGFSNRQARKTFLDIRQKSKRAFWTRIFKGA